MARAFRREKASYLLQEQKPAGREIIVGATESPGLGSLVMFGLGRHLRRGDEGRRLRRSRR